MSSTITCPRCNTVLNLPEVLPTNGFLCTSCGAMLVEPLASSINDADLRKKISYQPKEWTLGKILFGLAGIVGGIVLIVLGFDQIKSGIEQIFSQTARMSRTVKDGMEKQVGRKFQKVTLTEKGKNNWVGVALDDQGKEWDLLRVWPEGNMVRWLYRQPREQLEEQFKAQIVTHSDDKVKSVNMVKDENGIYSGTIETVTGIHYDIIDKRTPDGNAQVSVVLNPSSYAEWLKKQIAKQMMVKLLELKMKKTGDGRWDGVGKDEQGQEYEVILTEVVEPDPTKSKQLQWILKRKGEG